MTAHDYVAAQSAAQTGIPEEEVHHAVTFLKQLKECLIPGKDLTYAWAQVRYGTGHARENAWIELAITTKKHHYISIPAADKHNSPSMWKDLVDETIARLMHAAATEVRWWERPNG